MKIIFLSEHYNPRIGGVTTYVRNTTLWFSKLGHDVTLLIPGELDKGKQYSKEINEHCTEVYFGIGATLQGDITSLMRKEYIAASEKYLKKEVNHRNVDVVHILFGLYTMYYLDIYYFQKKGIPVGVTIHNIPPAECGKSWKEDGTIKYTKEKLRLLGAKYINRKRIKKYNFDYYITPSEHVKKMLNQYVAVNKVFVIGHGLETSANFNKKKLSSSDKIIISLVGGFVPHKRQHYVIDIANSLQAKGLPLTWCLVGPIRNEAYYSYVMHLIETYNLKNITVKTNVSNEELHEIYIKSDMYLQPSSEEGFCMTVLEAAAFGLPIVGTKTGAIPEIITMGSGIISGFKRSDIEASILELTQNISQFKKEALLHRSNIAQQYTWLASATKLEHIIKYNGFGRK